MITRKKNLQSGFTLLETIVAVSLILVGLTAVLTLLSQSLFFVPNLQNRLIAAHLAQEGLETVRGLRNNNWLQSLAWNNGLGDGDYNVSYDSLSLGGFVDTPLLFSSGTGLYNYSSGAPTIFKRKISIANLSAYEIRAVATVSWQSRGTTYQVSAEEHLFNWK